MNPWTNEMIVSMNSKRNLKVTSTRHLENIICSLETLLKLVLVLPKLSTGSSALISTAHAVASRFKLL